MRSNRSPLLLLTLYFSLVEVGSVRSQTTQIAELTGTVSDTVSEKAVDGADVVLRDSSSPPKELARVVSGSDGKYIISGLKPGDKVVLLYQRGGYLPHPGGPVPVVLVAGANVKDLQLMADSNQSTYWSEWAKKVKAYVEPFPTNPKQKEVLYNEFWSDLSLSGFSSIAQALAARNIVEATPEVAHSRLLMSFASVDLDTLQKAVYNIRAAVDGQGTPLQKYPIPPDVAVAIAASELKKQGSTRPQPGFMQDFGAVWGEEATGNLSNKLSSSPKKMDYPGALERMHLMANQPTFKP